ncbi:MAG: hypothetical protein AAFY99_14705 [Pseudomonadota bacterium]
MSDNTPETEVDVTKAWQATQNQKSSAKRLRIFAGLSWLVAIGAEVAGIVLLLRGYFDQGNLAILIGLLVAIAAFAIGGSLLWKAANKHDPASRSEPFRFFVQNQLGAIITLIAFLPLIVLILMDKDMDPKNKQIATGVGAVLAVVATAFGISYQPPSIEQYSLDMNECAAQIRSGEATTACSPEVAEQAQDIARDTEAVAAATADADNPNGRDVVYWITPPDGLERHDSPRVFHLCEDVSVLRDKPVSSGTVTEAYSQNVIRITKQITMEQNQCGFATAN